MEQETTQPNTEASIQNIQSVLFYLGEPVSFKKLASLFEVEVSSIEALIPDIEMSVKETGLSLVIHDGQIQLVTSPSSHQIIEKLRKDELTKELSKAALETLSIILYQDNVSRGDIDFIRGVNSSFILRNLLVRGLIIRKPHPTDARAFIYTGSHELFAFLGVGGAKELPEFERVRGLLQEKVEHLGDSQKENE